MEPHGEGRLFPGNAELPNAGMEVEPNAGAANAGVVTEVAGFEPNAGAPKAGAGAEVAGFASNPNAGALVAADEVDVEGVPHTDVR